MDLALSFASGLKDIYAQITTLMHVVTAFSPLIFCLSQENQLNSLRKEVIDSQNLATYSDLITIQMVWHLMNSVSMN